MPPFPKPAFSYGYEVASQLAALPAWRDTKPGRLIPAKQPDRLLVATWNIATSGYKSDAPRTTGSLPR